MSTKWVISLAAVVIALLLLSNAIFTVNPGQTAIMLRFGEVVESELDPGVHFKIPIVNKVMWFDDRLLTLDAPAERFLTVNKKNLLVDYFAKWEIIKPVTFYRATGGNIATARARLNEIIKDRLRAGFGKRTVQEVVTAQRAELMEHLRVSANKSADTFGVNVVDVRIKRIELPAEVSGAVFARMRSARAKVAQRLRSEGKKLGSQIRARADRKHTVILADARQKAQTIRGQGDARAAKIYAQAYTSAPGFYAFYRSLRAYDEALSGDNSVLVLSPDSSFFQFLEDPDGCGKNC